MRDMNIEESDPTNKLYKPDGASGATDDSFRKGDQKRLF